MANGETNRIWWWMMADEEKKEHWKKITAEVTKKCTEEQEKHGAIPEQAAIRTLAVGIESTFSNQLTKEVNFQNDMSRMALQYVDWFELSQRLMQQVS